jgi:hypothetical protein
MERAITELDVIHFLEHVKIISGNKYIYVLNYIMNLRFVNHKFTAELLIEATSQMVLDIERMTHSGISLEITPDKFCWLWHSLPMTFVNSIQDYNYQPVRFIKECCMM